MKLFAFSDFFGFLAISCIFLLSACKKDRDNASLSIIGKWSQKEIGTTNNVQQYEFKIDSTFDFYEYEVDTGSKNIVGYEGRLTGKFKVEKSTLTLYNLSQYDNPTQSYGTLAQLAPVTGPEHELYTIRFNSSTNQLFLYFTCPINADCVPSPLVYNKE